MADVKHMKWWGWGVEGVSFHHENKPAFRPFVLNAIDLDVNTRPTAPMSLDDLPIPAPMISDQLLTELTDAVGAEYAVQDDLDRIVHTYGKSARDLLRIRAGDIPRVPDVVVYPGDEAEVQLIVDRAVAADAVLIPYGGGSNISGSLHAPEDETRPVISVDLGRLDQVIDIDEDSGLARIQAGAQGPDLEEQLGALGWTLGHFPDSFTHSTLGGWVATRSSGMQSDKYGDISDIARGMRVVMPGKVLEIRPLPHTSTGPSVREMVLGSEGRLGVITEVTVQVHRIPEVRLISGVSLPVLGGQPRRNARDLHQRCTSIDHPSFRREGDSVFLCDKEEVNPPLDLLVDQQRIDEGTPTAWLEAGRDLPVLHWLRGRQIARVQAEGDCEGHRGPAWRDRGRQGSGRAVRPEEV